MEDLRVAEEQHEAAAGAHLHVLDQLLDLQAGGAGALLGAALLRSERRWGAIGVLPASFSCARCVCSINSS